jgi:hypothetical protein
MQNERTDERTDGRTKKRINESRQARTGDVTGADDRHALRELVELEETVRVDAVLERWIG